MKHHETTTTLYIYTYCDRIHIYIYICFLYIFTYTWCTNTYMLHNIYCICVYGLDSNSIIHYVGNTRGIHLFFEDMLDM